MNQQDIRKRLNTLESHAGNVDSAIASLLSRVDSIEDELCHVDEDEARRYREEYDAAYTALMHEVRARDPQKLAEPPRAISIEQAVDVVVDQYEAKRRGEGEFVDFAALLPPELRDAA